MKKKMISVLAVLFLVVSAHGFWSPTPVSVLSKTSSEVVIGKVVDLKANLKKRRVLVTLEIVQLLKGAYKKKKLSFDAPFSLVGDVVIKPLPKDPSSYTKGEYCLVFLKKVDGAFVMTMDTDGKYLLDKNLKNYKLDYVSNGNWTPVVELKKQIK